MKHGQLITSYLRGDIGNGLCLHSVNLDEAKRKGTPSYIGELMEQGHMSEQAVFGDNEGSSLIDMVGLNMGLA